MSYLSQSKIASSPSMYARIAQAAATEGEEQPDLWTSNNARHWAAAPGWDEAWEYAVNTHPPVEGEDPYDPGADETVITDQMILSTIQPMMAPETPPA